MEFESCPKCGKIPKVEWHFSGWYTAKCDCHKSIGYGNERIDNYIDCMNEWNDYVYDTMYERVSTAEKNTTELTLEEMRAERLRRLSEEF